MAKTKAELLNEYRELKKENLKLTNQLEHWKAIARKENDRVVVIATKLDECKKEKTLVQSQRDVLLLDYENMSQEADSLREDMEILQAEIRKIQVNEEIIHEQAYDEGYRDAERKFKQALSNRDSEIEDLLDHCDIYWWILRSLHENAAK